jgi:cell division protein FtsQ
VNLTLMGRSRAATPAGKRRTSSRAGASAPVSGRAAPKAASARGSATKTPSRGRPPAKRAAPKRATRATAPRRAARRPAPRRAVAHRGPSRAFSRPHPIRAIRGRIGTTSWRYRLGIVLILAVCAAAGYMFWLRDSSLVAVNNVDVVGVTSGDREQIVSQLTVAAEQQTTLHTDPAKLERLAAGFPTIASVNIETNFPHGMRIEVNERPPALIVESGHQKLPAAADGTLLAGVSVPDHNDLPVLAVDRLPNGQMLEGNTLSEALVLGSVPPPLRPLIEKVSHSGDYGVEVTLRGGIPIRFGSGIRAAEKWASAATVLANPDLTSLTYLDVRVPERPVAGGQPADPVNPPA